MDYSHFKKKTTEKKTDCDQMNVICVMNDCQARVAVLSGVLVSHPLSRS